MKSSSFLLIVAAALGLPELSWARCDDAYALREGRCQCNYYGLNENGDTIRCAFHGVSHGNRWLCACASCPPGYRGYSLRDVDAISQPKYNGRHKCRDNENDQP
ncbi:hypothetical protein Vi05172_g7374 [Venturia inaequalis]|nr:hypothetical protein Vi05172_g7374 [Venturia inaequalis]